MKFSLAQSFFRKYNAHNRIPNGILEKNFIDFFGNFSTESDYEPFVAYSQPFGGVDTINIDWCTKDDTFFVSIYDDKICLIKNDVQVSSVNVNAGVGVLVTVGDYAKGWTE